MSFTYGLALLWHDPRSQGKTMSCPHQKDINGTRPKGWRHKTLCLLHMVKLCCDMTLTWPKVTGKNPVTMSCPHQKDINGTRPKGWRHKALFYSRISMKIVNICANVIVVEIIFIIIIRKVGMKILVRLLCKGLQIHHLQNLRCEICMYPVKKLTSPVELLYSSMELLLGVKH